MVMCMLWSASVELTHSKNEANIVSNNYIKGNIRQISSYT